MTIDRLIVLQALLASLPAQQRAELMAALLLGLESIDSTLQPRLVEICTAVSSGDPTHYLFEREYRGVFSFIACGSLRGAVQTMCEDRRGIVLRPIDQRSCPNCREMGNAEHGTN